MSFSMVGSGSNLEHARREWLPEDLKTKVGIIGLGAMGGNAAKRLDEVGFKLVVYDTRPQQFAGHPNATAATSIADLAAKSDVILAFLPYSKQVEEVALGEGGVIGAASPGTIFVNMSTISPSTTQKIAQGLAPKGVDVIGAPMNGGPHVARTGELSLVVGGKDDVIEKCRPVLEALGKVGVVGDVGAGEMAKIVNNLILAICIQANTEALVLGTKFGVDPEKLVDAVIDGVGFNHGMRKHFKHHVLTGDFSENDLFSVDYMRKDLALAFELGDELKVPLMFGRMTDQMYQAARAKGRAHKYHAVVATVLEDLCGVKIRGKNTKGDL
jgi:3-hydroxyisobutyrate dehydrogenase-like beta-hydroxyacid dehydrogenase